MYTTVIFDLDGTLLDTLDDLTAATVFALTENGLPPRSRDEVREFVGNGLRKLAERAAPAGSDEETVTRVYDTLVSYYGQHSRMKTRPYPGIPGLLDNLRRVGCSVAVVSNKADFAVRQLVPVFFPGQIDTAFGESEGVRKKPAPDLVLRVMTELHAVPGETVYIGDSDVDIETAKNAGIDAILVDWGFRSRQFLLAHGAERIVSSADELYGAFVRK